VGRPIGYGLNLDKRRRSSGDSKSDKRSFSTEEQGIFNTLG
jgi:hypothetical protein